MRSAAPSQLGVVDMPGEEVWWRPTVEGYRSHSRRGLFVHRALATADLSSLVLAFVFASWIGGGPYGTDVGLDVLVVLALAPLWLATAALLGLYARDQERVDHSSVDEFVPVLALATAGAWTLTLAAWMTHLKTPHLTQVVVFWMLSLALLVLTRGAARTIARRSPSFAQRTLILGAGDIGQLAARKLLQHPEYKLDLLGFVDSRPRPLRSELAHLEVLGGEDRLIGLIDQHRVDRVIVAFSDAAAPEILGLVRRLRALGVHVDVIPRLFESVGPGAELDTCEGLAVVGLPVPNFSPMSCLLKRWLDCVVAVMLLLVLTPLLLVIAVAIRVDSDGPALFRQRRLGLDMRPFTLLKFRTMVVDTDHDEHRQYIERTRTHAVAPNENGLYKLERTQSITRVGRFLRRTSLDELPQLLNIVAGQMSLVGPRPCLDYETHGFQEHHFERFMVPPGLTGLWQVTARACATFGEALDMDVAYVRGWSFALDLRLLLKTPSSLVRMRGTR